MPTEADTCRRYVVPGLYAAGWTDGHNPPVWPPQWGKYGRRVERPPRRGGRLGQEQAGRVLAERGLDPAAGV